MRFYGSKPRQRGDFMKKRIGRWMVTIGANLWQNGGWTGDETYEDLTISGKLGYNMFCKGIDLMGVPLTVEFMRTLKN